MLELTIPAVMPPVRSKRWLATTSLLGIAAVWGATFFMVKDATSHFSVVAFLALRFSIASTSLLPSVVRVRRWPSHQEWKWGLLAGMLFCGGYIFQTFSLRLIDSGRTGFITGLYVVMVPILALLLLRQPLRTRVIIGAGFTLVGMIFLSYAPGGNLLGDGLAVLCALSYSCHILVVEKFPRGCDWRIMATVQAGVVALLSTALLPLLAGLQNCLTPICAALASFADPIPTTIPLVVLVVAAFTGLLATAVGLAIQVWAQRILPPSETALIFAMESPFAALFGVTLRGESLSGGGFLGCGLILAGMLTTTLSTPSAQAIPQQADRELLDPHNAGK